jgi:hypothetical protein
VADEKRRMAAVKLLIFLAAVGLPAVLRFFLEEQKNLKSRKDNFILG